MSERLTPVAQTTPAAPPRRRMTLARILTLLFVLPAILVLPSEIAARAYDHAVHGIPWSAAPDLQRDLVLFDSLGPRGRPNGVFRDVRLNSGGFRSSEAALTRQASCTRIMTLGSSETMGAGSEGPGQEYPAQLADSLASFGCCQVLNAGIAGMSLRGIIRFWNAWGARFHPDIVLVMAQPANYLQNAPPRFPAPIPGAGDPREPWWRPRLLEKAHQVIHYPDFLQKQRSQNVLDAETRGQDSSWFFWSAPQDRLEMYGRDLDSLVVAIRALGSEPILIGCPNRIGSAIAPDDSAMMTAWREYFPRVLPPAMLAFQQQANQSITDLGSRANVTVVDLPAVMSGHREFFADFVHFTKQGAGVIAGNLAKVVLTQSRSRP